VDPERLSRESRIVLKDEPAALVELLGSGRDAVVRKTYRNFGLRLLQTFLRRTRAEREHHNLVLATLRGLPCTPPVACSAERRLGLVRSSTLVTGYLPASVTFKQALAAARGSPPQRRQLLSALGVLLRRVHDAGVLWCTAMPRNVLVQSAEGDPHLLLCDLPAAIDFGRPLPRSAANIDLYDACGSHSRRLEMSRPERFRCLLAYVHGDRAEAGRRWRDLARRTALGHRIRKNLVMALRTYILPAATQTRNQPAR
jgi:tRNA A-37 threonylcarbamoyl transferase component Bud32